MKNQSGFSIIELVFVIVVLGIIASIAIPKLSLTRSDAQYTAIMADIQTIHSSIQQKFLTQDLDNTSLNGDFIMQTAGLSSARWIATQNGVRLAKNNEIDLKNNCVLVDLTQKELSIKIDSSFTTALCQKLSKAYPKPMITTLKDSPIRF